MKETEQQLLFAIAEFLLSAYPEPSGARWNELSWLHYSLELARNDADAET